MSTPDSNTPAEPTEGAVPPVPPAYAPPAYTPPPAYAGPPAYTPPVAPEPPYAAAPPAAGSYPPPYQAAPYAAPPAYGAPTSSYGAPAPGYGYGYAQPRTNVLAVISMIASIVGFIWILPFIGSLAGVIMGHISLKQIAQTGERGRGMALAGVIVGWVGLGIVVLTGVGFIIAFAFAGAASWSRYS